MDEIKLPVLLVAYREEEFSCSRCLDSSVPSVFETQTPHDIASLEIQLAGYLANGAEVLVYRGCEKIAEVEMGSGWRGEPKPLVSYWTDGDGDSPCDAERDAWERLRGRLCERLDAERAAKKRAMAADREAQAAYFAAEMARRDIRELERLRKMYPDEQ